MDATIKSTDDQTIIRLANGCTVTVEHRYGGKISSWAPGARVLYQSQRDPDDLDLRDAMQLALSWRETALS